MTVFDAGRPGEGGQNGPVAKPGVLASPNIWNWPEIYERENQAVDPDGTLWAMLAVRAGWTGADVLDIGCGDGFHLPRFAERARWFNENRRDLLANLHQPGRQGAGGRFMLAMLDEDKLRRVLARMLDPNEFLADHGIRSLSRYHREHPYIFNAGGRQYGVHYLPAESDTGMFGGNSNWRGPIWAPINALLIRSLLQMYSYYGNELRVECPTGSGQYMNLYEVAQELSNRLGSIFLLDAAGHRPVFGGARKFHDDPRFRDHLMFYEYVPGDNGAGLGASHQTGWTAIIPALMQLFARLTPEMVLAPDGTIADSASRPPPERDLPALRVTSP